MKDSTNSNFMKDILFADNTVLVQSDNNQGILQNSVKYGMAKVMDWLIANKISLNIPKIKYMLITNKEVSTESFVMDANGNVLTVVLSIRKDVEGF